MKGRRMFSRFGTLVLIASQVCLVRSSAQSSTCPDGLPSQQKPEIRVIIDAVEFHGENSLSEAERAALTEEIKKTNFVASSATEDDWANEVAEVAIRGAFQDKGYFKVFAQSTPHLVRAEEHELHYVLRLDIESGSQYRLGNVRFKNNQDGPLVFSETVLRQQLQLKSGDLFAVPKVRKALEGITKLYNSQGYVDMVPAPETDINEVDSSIDLTIKIDEASPYRIGSIEILSPDRSSFNLSPLPQSRGDVFNHGLWSKLFEDGTLKSMARTASHTLEITLDFRPCHGVTVPETSQSSPATREGVILRTIREH
jgi:surface antigen-like variable number repeat protein